MCFFFSSECSRSSCRMFLKDYSCILCRFEYKTHTDTQAHLLAADGCHGDGGGGRDAALHGDGEVARHL